MRTSYGILKYTQVINYHNNNYYYHGFHLISCVRHFTIACNYTHDPNTINNITLSHTQRNYYHNNIAHHYIPSSNLHFFKQTIFANSHAVRVSNREKLLQTQVDMHMENDSLKFVISFIFKLCH